MKLLDENGTAIAYELFDGRVRIITDADKLPQGHPVWLTYDQAMDFALDILNAIPLEGG